jgi:hypothetical protein
MEFHADGGTIGRLRVDTVDSPFPFAVSTAQTETERILTDRLATTAGTLEHGLARRLRNYAMQLATALAPVQHMLADQLEETDIAYPRGRGAGEPQVVSHLTTESATI